MEKKNKIWQYWSTHIKLSILLVVISALFILLSNNYLSKIPRSVIPFLGTILATLLGLTFTAFSILVAITPNIRKDFIATYTFDNIGKTFYFTLIIQFIAVILAFISYVFFSTWAYFYLLRISIMMTIFSFAFLIFLVRDMFILFKGVRNKIIEKI